MSHKQPLDPNLLQFARDLRHSQTTAEYVIWSLLRDRQVCGFKFRRQHPVEPYVLDFYCHRARLAIEIDGAIHNSDQARARDLKRSAAIAAKGIRVLRFWNNEVMSETDTVLEVIYRALVAD